MTEYLSLFKDADPSQMTGEASTFYLYSKVAQEEIKSFNPHAKIIIMLRNPIDFLHSLHAQFLFSGNEDAIDFSEALVLEKERTQGHKLPPFIDLEDKLFYREQVRRMPSQVGSYIQTFGNKNVLIIGGSNGLGEIAVNTLCALGANVTFTYNNNYFNSDNIALELKKSNIRCNYFKLDVTKIRKKDISKSIFNELMEYDNIINHSRKLFV